MSLDSARKEEYFEDVDDALKAQSANNTTLEITNLNKIYKNKKHAVRGLDLTMYSDQIFALLGHNGAGKTTTISMISGLLPITSGDIKVMGLNTQGEAEKIKEIMGVCP
jgi:ATP-binding cassette subfamily A (ABC1) protein 3